MQTWGWDNANNLTGFMLLASELLSTAGFADVSTPVMHLSGDLDGLKTLEEYAPVFRQLHRDVISYP